MRKATRYASTSAVPAIAAVLALISTPALAQEVPAQSAPTATPSAPATTQSAPTTDPAPVTVDTPAAPDTTAAPVATETPAPTSTTVAHKAAPKTAAKAAPKPTVTHTVVHTARAAVPAAPVAAAPKPAPATPTVKPIVDTQAAPAQPAAHAAKPASSPIDNKTMELGGGAIVLLALGAGAYALSRRRRDDEEYVDEGYDSEPMAEAEPQPQAVAETVPHHDPIVEEQPAMVAPEPSAFAWGNSPSAANGQEDDGSDRRPGETWVERAYRGPSPANPSVSLRNRLRRAAFFDKRERDVEAGKAEPIDAGAGLPDGLVENQERELA